MRKPSPEQLALLDLPPQPRQDDERSRAKKRAAASNAVLYSRELLAELDRVQAAQAEVQHDPAEHLAMLFEAAERAHQARQRVRRPSERGRRTG
jgi:hypothetical protein